MCYLYDVTFQHGALFYCAYKWFVMFNGHRLTSDNKNTKYKNTKHYYGKVLFYDFIDIHI